jgi:hypothetical protein
MKLQQIPFEERMKSESARNYITMQEYSNGAIYQRYKNNKLFEPTKVLNFKLKDMVHRHELMKKVNKDFELTRVKGKKVVR